MELSNEFEVAVPIEEAWAVLTDVERIAPCLPGAELREVEGDEYRGVVKVKVGPITASYRGAAHFIELDETSRRAVLKAEGRETRGQGNASATVTAAMVAAGSGTKVTVTTDLSITGKVAQFGRGVLAEVSAKLLEQFVSNLHDTVLAPGGTPGAAGAPAPADVPSTAADEPAEKPAAPKPARQKAAAAAPAPAAKPARRAKAAPAAATEPEPEAPTAATEPEPEAPAAAAEPEPEAPAAATEPEPEAPAIATEPQPAASEQEPEAPPRVRRIEGPPAEPVDLFDVAGASLAERLGPVLGYGGLLIAIALVVYAIRRRRG